MSRLLTCGWETGDLQEGGVTASGGPGTGISLVGSTPTPRAGSYCMKLTPLASSGQQFGDVAYATFALPAAKTDVWIRFAFYCHGITGTLEPQIVRFVEPSGGFQCYFTYTPSDGLIRLYRTGGTFLAASSAGFAQDGWHALEFRYQATSFTAGIAEVWVDGNQVINFSGDIIGSAGLFSVQLIHIGTMTGPIVVVPLGSYLAFDDVAINDTAGSLNNGRPGDGRVLLLSPTGAGTTTQLTRGGTDTGANWSQVNETPGSMVQYVGSATVGQRDLYTLADIGVAASGINVVEAIALAQNSDVGAGSLAPTVKSGVTTNEATAIGLATTPGYVVGRWETDPNTSAAWTVAAVNALEGGVTIR
jgi:hypothetical protein